MADDDGKTSGTMSNRKYLRMNPLLRPIYVTCGCVSLCLGFIGAFLPVLPTTPFVILSAYCFSKSHPEWHRRLRANERFGGLLRDWEEHGAIPFRGKVASLVLIGGLCAYVWYAASLAVWIKGLVTVVEAAALVFIWTRPAVEGTRRTAEGD